MDDLDGDGNLDLIVGVDDGRLKVWFNHGNYNFVEAIGDLNPFHAIVAYGHCASPLLVDVNGDGARDLVAGNRQGYVQVWLRRGSGNASSFTLPQAHETNPFASVDVGHNAAPIMYDINGDGHLDLIVGNEVGSMKVWFNSGKFTFPIEATGAANPFNLFDACVPHNIKCFAAPFMFDLDGNGFLDLVVGNNEGRVAVWRNSASNTFPTEAIGAGNPFHTIAWAETAFMVDANSDGYRDLVVSGTKCGAPSVVELYLNSGSNAFRLASSAENPFHQITVPNAGRRKCNGVLFMADVNGDSYDDVLIGTSTGIIAFWPNSGYNTFPTSTDKASNPFGGIDVGDYAAPIMFDLNGDGHLDLIVGGCSYNRGATSQCLPNTGKLSVWFNSGSNTFPSMAALLPHQFPSIAAFTRPVPIMNDINGDGLSDLLVGTGERNIRVWLNHGNNTFPTEATGSANPFFGYDLGEQAKPFMVDLNGDGADDIVVGNGEGKLRVFFNGYCELPARFSRSLCSFAGTCYTDGSYGGPQTCTCFPGYKQGVSYDCKLCDAGYGKVRDTATCEACPLGTWDSGNGTSCALCPIGHSCIGGTSKPRKCANPTTGGGSATCTPCGAGVYDNLISNGTNATCTLCPRGYACRNGLTKVPCSVDTYAGEFGSAVCLPVVAGYFRPNASAVEQCPRGSKCAGGATPMVPCPIGRYASSKGANDCNTCSDGTFTESTGNIACEGCPTQRAICKNGRLSIVGKSWYAPNTKIGKSTEMYECFNDDACVLHSNNTRVHCNEAKGYFGPLCGACDLNRGAMRTGHDCAFCVQPPSVNVVLAVLLVVGLVALIGFLAIQYDFDVPAGVYIKTVQKLGISFLQMLGMLGIFKARGTKVFNDVMSRPAEVVGGSFSSLLPVKCMINSQSYGPFFINMALPVVIPTLAAVILVPNTLVENWLRLRRQNAEAPAFKGKFNLPRCIAKCRCLRNPMTQTDVDAWRGSYKPLNRFAGIAVFTLFTLYPTLVSSIASIFNCTGSIAGKRYLVADYTVVCYEGGHIYMVIVACIASMVYAAGIPVAMAIATAMKTPVVCRGERDAQTRKKPCTAPRFVWKRRKQMKYMSFELRMRLGFLFAGYSTDRSGMVVAWEALVMLRKLAVTLAASAVADPYLQVLFALLILIVSCVSTAYVQPYEITMLNLIDIGGLFVLIVTQILSIMYFYAESVERPFMDRRALEAIVTAFLFLLNISALLSFLIAYIIEVASLRVRWGRRSLRVVKVVVDREAVMNALLSHDRHAAIHPAGGGRRDAHSAAAEEVVGPVDTRANARVSHVTWWHHPAGVAVQETPLKIYTADGVPVSFQKWMWCEVNGKVEVTTGIPEMLIEVDDIYSLDVGEKFLWKHKTSNKLSATDQKRKDVGGAVCSWCNKMCCSRFMSKIFDAKHEVVTMSSDEVELLWQNDQGELVAAPRGVVLKWCDEATGAVTDPSTIEGRIQPPPIGRELLCCDEAGAAFDLGGTTPVWRSREHHVVVPLSEATRSRVELRNVRTGAISLVNPRTKRSCAVVALPAPIAGGAYGGDDAVAAALRFDGDAAPTLVSCAEGAAANDDDTAPRLAACTPTPEIVAAAEAAVAEGAVANDDDTAPRLALSTPTPEAAAAVKATADADDPPLPYFPRGRAIQMVTMRPARGSSLSLQLDTMNPFNHVSGEL
jgi:hypothetical protein